MAKPPENFYHPVCHLFQGQRLHYILLAWDTFEHDLASLMKRWLEEAHLEESTCLYWVLGDVDMVLRVWATAREIGTFREKLAASGVRWKRFDILLINQMSTWYQREIEKKNTFAAGVSKLLTNGCIKKETIPPQLTTTYEAPAGNRQKRDIQFLIFLETQYTTRSTLFYEFAAHLGDKQDEEISTDQEGVATALLKGFEKVSLYSYCTDQQQGVIIKGQVKASLFETLVEALVRFSGGVWHGCFRTVTYVCTAAIRKSAPFRERQNHNQKPERSEIAYNLLKSQDCTYPLFDRPPENAAATKSAGTASGSAKPTDSEEQRDRLREHFIALISDKGIWAEFYTWSPRWWKNVEYLRLLFRWVVGGEGKNKQLIASLMRHYARLEMELRKVMPGADARDVIAKSSEKRLRAALHKAKFDREMIEKVTSALSADEKKQSRTSNEDDPFKLTLGTIVKKLESLHDKLNTAEKATLIEDEGVLAAAVPWRNQLMHGEAIELHGSQREGVTTVYEWEKHLRPFIRFYLRYHTLRARIEKLWREHGAATSAQSSSHGAVET